jgi:hypothetical protein
MFRLKKYKALALATTFLGIGSIIGGTYWISKCINLNTITFGDSEAAYYTQEIKRARKNQQPQPVACTGVDIPLHMRKYV